MTRKYAADIGKFPSLRAKSKCRNLTIPDAWEQVRFPNMPEEHSPGNHTVAGLQPRRRYLMRACGSLRLVVVRHMPARCTCSGSAAGTPLQVERREFGQIGFPKPARAPAPAVSPAPSQPYILPALATSHQAPRSARNLLC